jgi:hypothetical protein
MINLLRSTVSTVLLCLFAGTLFWSSGDVKNAAPATPAVPGISEQLLAETTLASLPPPPAIVALSRLTLAPNGAMADISVAGSELISVESGSLEVSMPGDEDEAAEIESRVRRGGTPIAGGLATPSEGIFRFTLVSGDSIFVPGDTTHTIRNASSEEATLLAAAVTPQPASNEKSTWPPGAPDSLPEGVRVDQLDVGYAAAVSQSPPARMTLQRITGNSIDIMARHQAGGPELFVVEQGELEIDIESGTVVSKSSLADRPVTTQSDETAAAPATVRAGTGGAALIQTGTIAEVRKASAEPLTILVLTVLPV